MRWKRKASRGAIKTIVDGITFDSKLEASRYSELKLLEAAGEIKNLVLQPEFPLEVNGELVCTYILDFFYLLSEPFGEHTRGNKIIQVAEDAKGFLETHTRIKIKLAQALYPHIEFRLWPERVRKKRKKK